MVPGSVVVSINLVRINLQDYNGAGVPGMDDLLWQFDLSFIGNPGRKLVLDHRLLGQRPVEIGVRYGNGGGVSILIAVPAGESSTRLTM